MLPFLKMKMLTLLLVLTLVMVGRDFRVNGYTSPESYYQCDRDYIGKLGAGVITHYNYPFNYTERLNCRHRIFIQPFHSSVTWTICFTFQRFRLTDSPSCSDDYLEFVSDGMRFCGDGHRGSLGMSGMSASAAPSTIFTSPLCWSLRHNTFDILFSSRVRSTNLGFFANYSITSYSNPTTPCTLDSSVNPSTSTLASLSPLTPVNCERRSTACAEDEFRCFTGATCIPASQVCDGVNQCSDESDESYAHARCPGKQDIRACTFEDGSICGMRLDGWVLDDDSPTGLRVDHTYRGVEIGRFLYSDYSQKDYVFANYTVPDDLIDSSGTHCLGFYYYMSGSVGVLRVRMKTVRGWSVVWMRTGSQAVAWLPADILIEPSMFPISEISFEVHNTPTTVRSVGLDDISLMEGQCLEDDISCTFSDGLCGWRHHLSSLTASWDRAQRVSPSLYTGPSSDHTDNNGWFLYFNASESGPGQTARLISRPISQGFSGSHCLHFWYHMFGAGMGSLRVYTLGYSGATIEVWERNGYQENKWLPASVTLSRIVDPFQIILEAERGTSIMSDMGVDDIQLTPGYCDAVDRDLGGLQPPKQHTTSPPTTNGNGCAWFEHKCTSSTKCYHMSRRCDGVPDCDDQSDEYFCSPSPGGGNTGDTGSEIPSRCKLGEVRCMRSLACIHKSKWCDGVIDCDDQTDEQRCRIGGGLLASQMEASVAPSVIIGSVIAGVIVIAICVLSFVIVRRRKSRRLTGRGDSAASWIPVNDGRLLPSRRLPRPVSPPTYSDLTPPPYSLLEDKNEALTPPPYDTLEAARRASNDEQAAQGNVRSGVPEEQAHKSGAEPEASGLGQGQLKPWQGTLGLIGSGLGQGASGLIQQPRSNTPVQQSII